MSKTTVIYHKADYDGIFCREIAHKFLGDGPEKRDAGLPGEDHKVEYIGWDYGDPQPTVPKHHKLYILDLAVPMLMMHPELVWIDHHATSIAKWGARPGFQIDGVSACRHAREQWRSLAKFLRMVAGLPVTEQREGPQFAGQIVVDTRPVINSLVARKDCRLLEVWFDSVLCRPVVEAFKVSQFLDLPLDVAKMAKQVLRRSPRCAPDMGVEMAAMAAEL